ncbi:helix-turn-helix transcriptional regulator [Erythrobacter sp. NE805]|uniref:helix-turn-helix transcriptional regulator n=1 Tax=Erythrobacter sp. NE805 TaxID=3389875 RepID=UPI00396B292F
MQRKTYRVHEVAQLLGIGRTTIYKLINEGLLQRIKLGATTLITAASVDALLPSDLAGGAAECR